ncbi:MAG: hypothetical protein V4702_03645 [Patescibacteria group bacterium]
MSISTIILAFVAVLTVLIGGTIFAIKRPRRLKVEQFIASWKELQSYCRDKATWSKAVIDADKLLNDALKKRKFKGKTMGERMVSAQRVFTNNDDMWFAHNLAKKMKSSADAKLSETDVKSALQGFRQALRDIGALPKANDEVSDAK